jgi:hypothetical protein
LSNLKKFLGKIRRSRIIKGICLVVLIISICPLFIFSGMWLACRSDQAVNLTENGTLISSITESTNSIPGYFRNEEQTYLTFPEWYIVYSGEEHAASISSNPPSKFPYFRSVGQYWNSYCKVYAMTRNVYPFNAGYHVILFVIGGSFTAENITKGLYENTIGRIAELFSTDELTEEDRYAQKVASEYGNFLHTIPWYEFPFKDKLKGLWRETALWGPNPARKWERKIILTAEYGFKAVYGWIIGGGTKTAYAPAELEIYTVVENLNDNFLAQNPDVRLVEKIDTDYSVIVLPRYEAFSKLVPGLIDQGIKFIEIAGNDEILISVLAPKNWELHIPGAKALFSMPVLIDNDLDRVAVNSQIAKLHTILGALKAEGVKLEHIYDY